MVANPRFSSKESPGCSEDSPPFLVRRWGVQCIHPFVVEVGENGQGCRWDFVNAPRGGDLDIVVTGKRGGRGRCEDTPK